MRRFSEYKLSVLAVIVAATGSAHAAPDSDCQQRIERVEQQMQQQDPGRQVRDQVEELIRKAEQNPQECSSYLAGAQNMLEGQTGGQSASERQQVAKQAGGGSSGGQSQDVKKASDLMGKNVETEQGDELGSIDDLALNMEEGELAYIVLSTGGMFEGKKIGVPTDSLQPAQQGDGFVTKLSRQEIQSAEALPEENWPAKPTVGESGTGGAGAGSVVAASKVMGKSVTSKEGEQLGDIDDFAIDMKQGKLAYVVLSSGGMLGGLIGNEKLIGVPAKALTASQDGYIAGVSKQEIEGAQGLPDENWPSEPTLASASAPEGAGGVKQSSRIQGQTVTNEQGETLGRIDQFALDLEKGKLAYVAIRTDQGKTVGLPADMLKPAQSGQGYVASISKQELESAQELPNQAWPDEPTVSGSKGGSRSGGGQMKSFASLDQNQDGEISEEEAQAGEKVDRQFDQIDENADDKIDRSEFAAFEARQRRMEDQQPGTQQRQQQQGGQQQREQSGQPY